MGADASAFADAHLGCVQRLQAGRALGILIRRLVVGDEGPLADDAAGADLDSRERDEQRAGPDCASGPMWIAPPAASIRQPSPSRHPSSSTTRAPRVIDTRTPRSIRGRPRISSLPREAILSRASRIAASRSGGAGTTASAPNG